MLDLLCSLSLLGVLAVLSVSYAAHVARFGAQRSKRVEQAGSSALLGKAPMDLAYWLLGPLVRVCLSLGVTANAVTWGSLVLGAAAGVLLAMGHFGIAVAAATASSLADALDGAVARASRTSSDAGEVLDAAVDRYVELFFLGGLVFYYRNTPILLVLALLAMGGSFMVSYSTAKAEALHVTPPRGAMRRAERAVYLTLGAGLVPVASALVLRLGVSTPASLGAPWSSLGDAPILLALGLVGVLSNASAARRLRAIAAAVRARDSVPLASSEPIASANEEPHATATSHATR